MCLLATSALVGASSPPLCCLGWPALAACRFPQFSAASLSKLIPSACPEAIDLISRMICWDPDKRLSSEQALRHPYFAVRRLARRAGCMQTLIWNGGQGMDWAHMALCGALMGSTFVGLLVGNHCEIL